MKSRKEVSISKARENLPSLVREAERGLTVTLTRRGKPVAVLISTDRYRRHARTLVPLSRALHEFRDTFDLDELDIDTVYGDVRDRSGGRAVRL